MRFLSRIIAITALLAAPARAEEKRPLFPQETYETCAIASSRMVLATMDGPRNLEEKALRELARDLTPKWTTKSAYGANPFSLAPLLRHFGVRARTAFNPFLHLGPGLGQLLRLKPVSRIKKWLAHGPVIAGLTLGDGCGHAIVIDKVVTKRNGKRYLKIRDPLPVGQGKKRTMSEAKFNRLFNYSAVHIKPKRPSWRSALRQRALKLKGALGRLKR